eukprot:279561-Rhodomonas_salina.1
MDQLLQVLVGRVCGGGGGGSGRESNPGSVLRRGLAHQRRDGLDGACAVLERVGCFCCCASRSLGRVRSFLLVGVRAVSVRA